MKYKKKKSKQRGRWVVATGKEIKAALDKGLFKSTISMVEREAFNLSPTHIHDFIFLVTEEIERQVFEYHQSGGEIRVYDQPQHNLMRIEELLYMLEDLFLTHTTIHAEVLFKKLSLVRKLVAFPKLVEGLFIKYEEVEAERHKKTDICPVCCKKEADILLTNMAAHKKCLVENGWYLCEACEWIYPTNKKVCERTSQCSGKTPIRFTLDYDQPF